MVMRSTDRILVLERINPKNKEVGLMDPKVFTGDNPLHAIMDPNTLLWRLKYEHGLLPPALKDRFTSFNALKDHADSYFKTRNIRIAEVKD